jgi:hypothetical protein
MQDERRLGVDRLRDPRIFADRPGYHALEDSAPVPPQFLGQARLARQHYAASVAVSPLMQAIATYCRGAYATKGGSSRVMMFAEKRWRALPGDGLVLQQIVSTGSKRRIRDVRACISTLWRPTWDESEPGICLIDNFLVLEKKRLSGDAAITCALSLHSMGRWFQRQLGGSGTIEALTSGARSPSRGGTWVDRRT